MEAKRVLVPAVALALLAGCRPAPVPATSTVPVGQSSAALQRELRVARLEQGLAAQKELLPWLRALPERYSTGYSRVEKQLLLDAVAGCVTETRVGAKGDGGKWLCNAYRIQAPCVVYGVGAGPEISYEEAMAEQFGCEVHMFDPSKESVTKYGALEKGQARGKGTVTYHPWALGPVSDEAGKEMTLVMDGVPAQVKRLDEIAKLLGHTKIDLLKIDIEGGEFAVLADLAQRKTLQALQVKQLEIEFHSHDLHAFGKLVTAIETLGDQGYLLFRKELNPYTPETCAEYAFAERAYLLD